MIRIMIITTITPISSYFLLHFEKQSFKTLKTFEAIHFQRNCRLVEASKLLKSGIPSEIFFKYFHHQSKDAFSQKKKVEEKRKFQHVLTCFLTKPFQ